MNWKKKRSFWELLRAFCCLVLYVVIPLYVFMYASVRDCEWLLGLLVVYCGFGLVMCDGRN